ncbi:hypothetical protein DFH06DRAFT_534496 [Mycena polygramma]|nr:hypothetical protein DFH06DRAFT_534496 [Mycena polygramma]
MKAESRARGRGGVACLIFIIPWSSSLLACRSSSSFGIRIFALLLTRTHNTILPVAGYSQELRTEGPVRSTDRREWGEQGDLGR